MTSVYPQDWAKLLDRVLANTDGPLADKMYNYYWKSSQMKPQCNSYCKRKLFCGFKQARPGNLISC
jgi:hypothetical protein